MSDQPVERPRRLVTTISTAVVLGLFFASLFLIFLTNRFSPTVAAERPPSIPASGGSIAYLGDFAICYRTTGTDRGNPPVILLLGGAGESGIGYHDCFGSLDSSRQVISYDPRGSGLSEVKPTLSHYTVSALVAELDAVREHVAKAESVIVIARGFGASVAVRYAREYPGRVDRLILLSPMPPDGTRYDSIVDLLGETVGALTAAGIPPANPVAADRWQDRYSLAAEHALDANQAPAARFASPHASYGAARSLLTSLASSRRWTARDVIPLPVSTLALLGPDENLPEILPVLLTHMRIVRMPAIPQALLLRCDPAVADTVLQYLTKGV
jgi:pimeloyl-ACP methyl ester carboxylesterase